MHQWAFRGRPQGFGGPSMVWEMSEDQQEKKE